MLTILLNSQLTAIDGIWTGNGSHLSCEWFGRFEMIFFLTVVIHYRCIVECKMIIVGLLSHYFLLTFFTIKSIVIFFVKTIGFQWLMKHLRKVPVSLTKNIIKPSNCEWKIHSSSKKPLCENLHLPSIIGTKQCFFFFQTWGLELLLLQIKMPFN